MFREFCFVCGHVTPPPPKSCKVRNSRAFPSELKTVNENRISFNASKTHSQPARPGVIQSRKPKNGCTVDWPSTEPWGKRRFPASDRTGRLAFAYFPPSRWHTRGLAGEFLLCKTLFLPRGSLSSSFYFSLCFPPLRPLSLPSPPTKLSFLPYCLSASLVTEALDKKNKTDVNLFMANLCPPLPPRHHHRCNSVVFLKNVCF